jgi:hypothetical protein
MSSGEQSAYRAHNAAHRNTEKVSGNQHQAGPLATAAEKSWPEPNQKRR